LKCINILKLLETITSQLDKENETFALSSSTMTIWKTGSYLLLYSTLNNSKMYIKISNNMHRVYERLLKGILSTSCVIFSYPKLLSISVLTFIKWRLTPRYVAKDTKKTQNYRYQNYCPGDNIQICSYGLLCEHVLSMRTV
jgi:hypothetical protein